MSKNYDLIHDNFNEKIQAAATNKDLLLAPRQSFDANISDRKV